MHTATWLRVLFALFIAAAFVPLCTYLLTYIKAETVQSKYLNLDVFVIIFYVYVIVNLCDTLRIFPEGPPLLVSEYGDKLKVPHLLNQDIEHYTKNGLQ